MANKLVDFFNSLDENIKVKFKSLVAEVKAEDVPAPAAAPMQETALQDGTILKYSGETLAVGSEVIIVTPEGEVNAPAGEHILADGSTIVVAIEGEKSVVKEVKPAEEMKKETPATPNTEAAFEAIKSEFAAFKAEVLKEFESLKKENEALKIKASKTAANLKETVLVVEAMANIPTAEPAKAEPMKPADKMLAYLASKNKK